MSDRPSPHFSFCEVVSICLFVHGAGAEEFTKWSSNIKYLQRQKVVPAYATGRGRPAAYDLRDVWQTLFAMELYVAGLTPTQLGPIINATFGEFMSSVNARCCFAVPIPTSRGRDVEITVDASGIAEALTGWLLKQRHACAAAA